MHKEKINFLLQQYMSGQLTESQFRELLQATGKEQEAELLEVLQKMMEVEAANPESIDYTTLKTALGRVIEVGKARVAGETGRGGDASERRLDGRETGEGRAIAGRPVGRIGRRLVAAVAAVFILALGMGAYLWSRHHPTQKIVKTVPSPVMKNDVAPGGNKAVLTLSDGTQIVLDSATNGVLSSQGKSKVLKLNSGQLAYTANGESLKGNSVKGGAEKGEATLVYNTITTPRGGQYQLVLADGTKVWLNASSSLRYPVAFTGRERRVELSGEGYFEIAKNATMPFRVKANDLDVDVLGTHFNVNAYADETAIKTTLLEGAVKVTSSVSSHLLLPGQQAQLNKEGLLHIVSAVDLEEVVAWKEGYFQFNQADLKSIMRQISRWYDVDIRYEGEIPNRQFGGDISRTANVSEVLNILKMSQVHFRIEGRTIVLTP